MTTREQAQMVARIAIYGSATALTPADLTLREALRAGRRAPATKDKTGDQVVPVVANDAASYGPMFEPVVEDELEESEA